MNTRTIIDAAVATFNAAAPAKGRVTSGPWSINANEEDLFHAVRLLKRGYRPTGFRFPYQPLPDAMACAKAAVKLYGDAAVVRLRRQLDTIDPADYNSTDVRVWTKALYILQKR